MISECRVGGAGAGLPGLLSLGPTPNGLALDAEFFKPVPIAVDESFSLPAGVWTASAKATSGRGPQVANNRVEICSFSLPRSAPAKARRLRARPMTMHYKGGRCASASAYQHTINQHYQQLSTHYQHTINTLSTHYQHTINTINTLSTVLRGSVFSFSRYAPRSVIRIASQNNQKWYRSGMHTTYHFWCGWG